MQPIVTDGVAWSVTVVIPAKTAELIEMLFGLWTWVGPGNHVFDGDPDLSAVAILREKTGCLYFRPSPVSYAKMAEPFEMLLGCY